MGYIAETSRSAPKVLRDGALPLAPHKNGNGHLPAAELLRKARRNGHNGVHVAEWQAFDLQCSRTGYTYVKRGFDIAVSAILLILLAPVFLGIAIAIKLDSRGPVLIRQKRVGLDRRRQQPANGFAKGRRCRNFYGKPFTLYKFRSMYAETRLYDVKPSALDDRRVTRIGRYLRCTSLDELPQLWNVLKGDMSLVGPRPEMHFIVRQYNDVQALRLRAKPGITGLWQLYGSRLKPIHENVHLDLEYIANQSWQLDLRILLKTLKFALAMKNF